MSTSEPRKELTLVTAFANHKVAANLLMILMLMSGFWALQKLNTQFFPSFELDTINIRVPWSGASAEDVDQSITIPIQQALQTVYGIDRIRAQSLTGVSTIRIEVIEGEDVGAVLEDVKTQVDNIRNLPQDSETPVVSRAIMYEDIARVVVSGSGSLEELQSLAVRLEKSLYKAGIPRVTFMGFGDAEIAIQISPERLYELGLDFESVSQLIRQRSQDVPAGVAARDEGGRTVRSLSQARSLQAFRQLPLVTRADGSVIRLGDVAEINRRPKDGEATLSLQGKRAIELELWRTAGDDTLDMADILKQWEQDIQPQLPESVRLEVYAEKWIYLKERIDLLLENGLSGLILVLIILFLFMDFRIASWVALGIPTSFMAALAVLLLIGGSLNMISLFGLIMALGIIVDDAIVVGEESLTRFDQGHSPQRAAIGGAMRMLGPVTASSLTTIAAFLPLFIVGGTMGAIMRDIPLVVVCVIVASLIECFLILPGHLHHGIKPGGFGKWVNGLTGGKLGEKYSRFRSWFDTGFNGFRDGRFRQMVRWSVRNRGLTMLFAACTFVLALSLFPSGKVKFTFFPSVDSPMVMASVGFSPGTPKETVDRFMEQVEQALYEVDSELDEPIVNKVVQYHGRALFSQYGGEKETGDEYGALRVALSVASDRDITNAEFLQRWENKVIKVAGIEKLSFSQPKQGPPGKDIQLKIYGLNDPDKLKAVSVEFQDILATYPGVTDIVDDMPYGREQIIFQVNPLGESLGLTTQSVGQQVRASLDGQLLQIFYDEGREVEVRLTLPDAYRNTLSGFENLPLILKDGSSVPLRDVVDLRYRQGHDVLASLDNDLAVEVSATVNAPNNANEVMAVLRSEVMPMLAQKYGVFFDQEGRGRQQKETMADMKLGAMIAFALIFVILAWVFGVYTWPIAVMITIPLGLTGAIFGHMLMGIDLTIMSMFGFFALSGIVINDSIVLVTAYRDLRALGVPVLKAIEDASCARLRAVLLTTLTTIAGLTPIMFESSLQAQFLIPMANTLVFGLAFGTLLILFVMPSILVTIERFRHRGELV